VLIAIDSANESNGYSVFNKPAGYYFWVIYAPWVQFIEKNILSGLAFDLMKILLEEKSLTLRKNVGKDKMILLNHLYSAGKTLSADSSHFYIPYIYIVQTIAHCVSLFIFSWSNTNILCLVILSLGGEAILLFYFLQSLAIITFLPILTRIAFDTL
jgi:uncharacterized membrane protein